LIETFFERHPEHVEFEEANHVTVTELDVLESSDDDKASLFEIEVFPNNEGHASIVGSARRFRLLENRLGEINDYKDRIFQEKEKLAKELNSERMLRRVATKRAHEVEKKDEKFRTEVSESLDKLSQSLNSLSQTLATLRISLSRVKLALYFGLMLFLAAGGAIFFIFKKLGIL